MTKKLTVLAVDDDTINLKLISSLLKRSVHVGEILEATNGLEALNVLKSNTGIDLILLDIKMPIMDGIEFLTHLQDKPQKTKIPIIVLTTDETKKNASFTFGAFDFLVKPIREHELSVKIQKVVDLAKF